MNFSNFKLSAVVLLALVLSFASCSKEALTEDVPSDAPLTSLFDERIVDVTENYDYYGEKFSVTYRFDQETEEILQVSGDVARAEALFGSENYPKGSLVTPTKMDLTASSTIQLFDTQEEADALLGLENSNSKSCNYYDQAGTATFRYYKHSNYVSELYDLTKYNKLEVKWNFVMSHNNDEISSIAGNGDPSSYYLQGQSYTYPYVVLYEDDCFGGNHVNLVADVVSTYVVWISRPYNYEVYANFEFRVPNLSSISLYLGYWQGWSNWNDRVSSTRSYWRVS